MCIPIILNETLGLGIRILRPPPAEMVNLTEVQQLAISSSRGFHTPWTLTNGRTRRTQLPNSNTFSSSLYNIINFQDDYPLVI